MFTFLLLSVPFIQDPVPATEAEEVVQESEVLAELREHVDRLSQAKNYSFRMLSTSDSTGMRGGRGGSARGQRGQRGQGDQVRGQQGEDRPAQEGDRPAQEGDRPAQEGDRSQQGGDAPASPQLPQPWEGAYQVGNPVLMKKGEMQVVRNSDGRMAVKSGEGSWALVSMPGRGGQGRGGQGAGMDREVMRAMFEVRTARLPHDMLATVLEGLDGEKLMREEKLGLVVFHGPLTEEAALQLAGGGRMMGGRGGFGSDRGGEAPQMLGKGKVRIAFSANGKAVDLMIETEMMGTFGDREFSRSSKSEIRAAKIGETEMEVPAAAIQALSQDPALEEEF
ncbi:MAG: hypothetical protein MK209_08790 [Planctomycetes bacterium]|nr:hypothetical protein [Planctomycetota bacterium]